MRNADEGTVEIADSITLVARTAEDTKNGAQSTLAAAHELTRMADQLEKLVQRFRM